MRYLFRINFYLAPNPLLLVVTFPQAETLLPLSWKEVQAGTHLRNAKKLNLKLRVLL